MHSVGHSLRAHSVRAAALRTALLAGVLVPIGTTAAPKALTYAWSPARVDGGGFVTVLAPSPKTKNLWLAGSDVAGVFRSTDGGKTWSGATKGFEDPNERKVGAIEWDPFTATRAWACVGAVRFGVPLGAMVRTNDGGVTWATISRDAFCAGGVNPLSGVTGAHPRSTGRLVIADPTTKNRLFIGTVVAGVMRSTDGGVTWTSQGLSGLPIRGIAIDPQHPSVMFVAVRSATPGVGGVYRTADVNAPVPVWEHLAGPAMGEEVAILANRLYVAAGNQGLWAADLTVPTLQLTQVGQATLPLDATTDAMTVTAARIGNADTELVGIDADAVCVTLTWCPTVYRSTDGGTTWAPLPVDPSGVHPQILSPSGAVWRQAERPDTLLGGASHVASDIRVDPFATSHLLVAGRAGIWRSTDSGADWFPVPKGLTMTFHGQPSTDASRPGSVVVPTSDWNLLGTTNDGGSVRGITFPDEGGTSARLSGFTGAGSAPLYVGVGFGAPDSELYVQETAGAPFVPLGFGAASHAGGVLAVAARDVGGERVVVVIGRRVGVWRKVGEGPWTQVATAPGGPAGTIIARTGTLAWAADGSLYASDRGDATISTGVWRSLDSGATWEQVTPAMMDIAIDQASPDRLWLAGVDEVWRVDDARTGTTAAGTLVISQRTALGAARLITTDPAGAVIVVTSQVLGGALGTAGNHGQVFRSTNGGVTFKKVSTSAVSPGLVDPVGIAVGPNGVVHLATFGFGWWVGKPA